jgi:hypothetical protein
MYQRGRKSATELAAPRVNEDRTPMEPPPNLTNDERTLFTEIAQSVPLRHFVASDTPLLVSYVQATLLAREAIRTAATDNAALAAWEKVARVQAALATKLRLSPSSRYDPKTAARMPPTPRRPRLWEDDGD